jgi:hypothetical protein
LVEFSGVTWFQYVPKLAGTLPAMIFPRNLPPFAILALAGFIRTDDNNTPANAKLLTNLPTLNFDIQSPPHTYSFLISSPLNKSLTFPIIRMKGYYPLHVKVKILPEKLYIIAGRLNT